MALKTSAAIEHGLRTFNYVVEVSPSRRPAEFANPDGPWTARTMKVETVTVGYGSDDHSAKLVTWDADTVDTTGSTGSLVIPQNGEVIRISVQTDGGSIVVFKGSIRSVHHQRTDSGITYSVEAISEVSRLNDVAITMVANLRNNPMNPSPRFDSNGFLVEGKLKTVAEIIREIMDFKDAWRTTEFFTYDSIDWDGLEFDERCGGFTPSHMNFSDTPKGQAIATVLQKAGNFQFIYNPANDKLKIVEINLSCNRCGNDWGLRFPEVVTDPEELSPYGFDFDVIEDNTIWSSQETANVARITGGPISFYSGHRHIPERFDDLRNESGVITESRPNKHCVAIDNETAEMQKKRSINHENTWYRFTFPASVPNSLKVQHYTVGMPLFPDWNIFEDWMPAILQIQKVILPEGLQVDGSPATQAHFKGKYEYQSFTVGDEAARGVSRLNHMDNLRVYQAWHTSGDCPACLGSGLVSKVYSNSNNEPDLSLIPVDSNNADGPKRLVVTNYIMDPHDFGGREASGIRKAVPAGLLPFSSTTEYPLPWKNTCPYCRGVGRNPSYKIRNISSELYDGRNNKVKSDPNGTVKYISLDPGATQVAPESWEESQTRANLREGPILQIEQGVTGTNPLPKFASRNASFDDIKALPDGSDNVSGRYVDGALVRDHNQQEYKFPHPLQYVGTTNRKLLSAQMDMAPSVAESKIVPDNWHCEVPFTTIHLGTSQTRYQVDHKMGRVLFEEPVFIACKKDFVSVSTPKPREPYTVKVNSSGLLETRSVGGGKFTVDRRGRYTGFWRAAKVWMSCYYEREQWYEILDKNPAGQAIDPVTLTHVNPEGDEETYLARAMVIDGRYAVEVKKNNPNTTIEFGTGNRLIQTTIEDPNAKIAIAEEDLYKLPIPPSTNMGTGRDTQIITGLVDQGMGQSEAYKAFTAMAPAIKSLLGHTIYKRDVADFSFPVGRIFRWERPSAGEEILKVENVASSKTIGLRPRPYMWSHKDNRPEMLSRAIRHLESSNNLQVSGHIQAVNMVKSTADGLGWLTYPDRGKASVQRITYNFADGFVTDFEITRQEARYGELPPDAEVLIHEVSRQVSDLSRRIDQIQGPSRNPSTGKEGDGGLGHVDPITNG